MDKDDRCSSKEGIPFDCLHPLTSHVPAWNPLSCPAYHMNSSLFYYYQKGVFDPHLIGERPSLTPLVQSHP